MLRIYNTLTRKKEAFTPLVEGEVRLYVCGVTVYDLAHIGHARSALVFDMIVRYLRFKGYRVRYVKNFTDVDDKIIRRAQEEGVPVPVLADRYIQEYRKDMADLGVLEADVEPRATEHIPQMIQLIERLLAKGVAYRADGDVYFEVRRFPGYGGLSGKNLDELQAGARVEVDERKQDPLDFALWKASKAGEPAWESPWGPGRPGWHIECSAMSAHYLGGSFDIHGGGEDLIFPHHENEIAQSEAATGKPFVRWWIHNGLVNLGKEKMSKSLGNILLVQNLVEHHHPDHIRTYLLGTHYRNPVDFWEARLGEARRAIGRLRIMVSDAFRLAHQKQVGLEPSDQELNERSVQCALEALTGDELRDEISGCCTRFTVAMDDDFNTPQALGALFDLFHVLNRYRAGNSSEARVKHFVHGARILLILGRGLGLLCKQVNPYEFSPYQLAKFWPLVQQREGARGRRDWKRADALRAELESQGVTIEDTPSGPRLRWKDT